MKRARKRGKKQQFNSIRQVFLKGILYQEAGTGRKVTILRSKYPPVTGIGTYCIVTEESTANMFHNMLRLEHIVNNK